MFLYKLSHFWIKIRGSLQKNHCGNVDNSKIDDKNNSNKYLKIIQINKKYNPNNSGYIFLIIFQFIKRLKVSKFFLFWSLEQGQQSI